MRSRQNKEESGDEKMSRWLLTFSPATERLYRAQYVEQMHKEVAPAWLLVAILFNTFLISDYLVARPSFEWFVIARVLIVTPACMAIAALLWRKVAFCEIWAVVPPIILSGTLSILIVSIEGDFRQHYLFGNLLIMIHGCILARPKMTHAAVLVGLQFLIYIVTIHYGNFLTFPTNSVYFLLGTANVAGSMAAVYALDSFDRRSFLMGRRIEQLNRELSAQSLTDPLTGLANRRSFEQATTRHWTDPARRDEPVSIVLLDIDHFKLFNDANGHMAGDLCLKRIAGCITRSLPEGRELALRYGGEEMAVFLPATTFAEAREIAERIRLAIQHEAVPRAAGQSDEVVSASLGVATATPGVCDVLELLTRADTALYSAKRNGRNQVWPPLTQAARPATARIAA